MRLEDIKKSNEYIKIINSYILENKTRTLSDIINYCHKISPELKLFCSDNEKNFKCSNKKDKGLLGKIVEFYIFGNLPNSNSKPDTGNGDIKVTNLKELRNGYLNAKERLTLTNFGNPFNEEIVSEIVSKNSIKSTKYFEKISRGIIVVGLHNKKMENSLLGLLEKKIIGFVVYDFNNFNIIDQEQISCDFEKIKKCLLDGKPTQSGQKYLHIHRHSSGGENKTRAFGFTNKFLTKIIADFMGFKFIENNKSYYFDI
jgi:hypothetical protein